ncbi:MAG: PA14 domain-containing protein [bacterium]|nr:PA14 domain-containing protein [bacterium]
MNTRRFLPIVLTIICLCVLAVLPAGAQSAGTWRVDFFNNIYLSGSAVASLQIPSPNFNWGTGAPAANVQADNFSARITSSQTFAAGTYRFSIQADDEFTLRMNNAVVLNTMDAGQAGRVYTADVALTAGTHFIQIDYRERGGAASVSLSWQAISGGGVVIVPTTPAVPAAPVGSTSVVTRYGDYTRCIQQRLHQSQCYVSDGVWNSPDIGSIRMEPQIVLWQSCTINQQVTQVLAAGQAARRAQCSKTGAGFFPIN